MSHALLSRKASFFALVLFIGFGSTLAAQSITQGNLVVVRIGDGTGALTSAATPVFLDEYTTSGTLVQTTALPTTPSGLNRAMTNSGVATSEGNLNQSVDGRYLLLAGYHAPVGTASVAASSTTTVARVDVAVSELPATRPGRDGITTSNASDALPPAAVGFVSGSMIFSCSRTEPGHPCVMMTGNAPGCFERTWMKWTSTPSISVRN
jgi:hypothetical protein